MLKIDNVECNPLSQKLRNVFSGHRPTFSQSSISAISLNTLNNLGEISFYQSKVSPARVRVADGNLEEAVKVVDLPITIGNKTYFHATHVFKSLPVPLLIGDDFLAKHQDTLFFNGSTAELTLINSTINDTQYINKKSSKLDKKLLMQLESPQKCIAWESNPIKTKGKSLQKHSIEAPLEMINEVQYLVEVEGKGNQAFTTPQLSTCLNQHIYIFVANPLKNEMNLFHPFSYYLEDSRCYPQILRILPRQF